MQYNTELQQRTMSASCKYPHICLLNCSHNVHTACHKRSGTEGVNSREKHLIRYPGKHTQVIEAALIADKMDMILNSNSA